MWTGTLYGLYGCFPASSLADDIKPGSNVDAVDLANDTGRHGQELSKARPEQTLIVSQNDADGMGG